MKKTGAFILLVIFLFFIGPFLLYPLFHVTSVALFPGGQFSLGYFYHLFSHPTIGRSILNSLSIALITTALSALIALPLAFLFTRFRFPGKTLFGGLLLLPLIIPPFVGAIGMRQILARFGSLNLLLLKCGLLKAPIDWLGYARLWGVVLVEALHLFPIFYLNAAAALANVDPTLEEAALNLGSNRLRTFFKITVPYVLPSLFSGAVLVTLWSFTDLGTPLVFQMREVVPVQIFDRALELSDNPEGHALVMVMLLLSITLFFLGKKLSHLRYGPGQTKGASFREEKSLSLSSTVFVLAFIGFVLFLACLPHLAVFLTSIRGKWFMSVLPESYTLDYYKRALGHELALSSIRNSIFLSGVSTVIDTLFGVVIAYLLARKKTPLTSLFDGLVMFPLAIPGVVMAFGYLAAFSGSPLDPKLNPLPLLAIAYAVRRMPYMVRMSYGGFLQVETNLEEAGANLGSPPFKTFWKITLPLVGASVLAGAILTFAFSLLEVSESLILAFREEYFPLTKTIYQLLGRIEDGPYLASALGVWAMAFLGVSFLLASLLLGRRLGQLFRV